MSTFYGTMTTGYHLAQSLEAWSFSRKAAASSSERIEKGLPKRDSHSPEAVLYDTEMKGLLENMERLKAADWDGGKHPETAEVDTNPHPGSVSIKTPAGSEGIRGSGASAGSMVWFTVDDSGSQGGDFDPLNPPSVWRRQVNFTGDTELQIHAEMIGPYYGTESNPPQKVEKTIFMDTYSRTAREGNQYDS